MSQLTPEIIAKTAQLAQLEVSPEQITQLNDELSEIFDLFTAINTDEISATAPLSHPLGQTQRLREDKAIKRELMANIEENAPQAEARFITVPKVIE